MKMRLDALSQWAYEYKKLLFSACAMKRIGIGLIALMLSSCFAAFVAGGAAATGLVVYDRRPVAIIEQDLRIAHRINQEIVTNRQFSDSRIIVISFNQMVLLLGEVRTPVLKGIAERIAQKESGVHRVYDEMRVGYPISLEQKTKDTLLTGKVRSQMIVEKGLKSGSVRVVTEDGVVYLMGIVTPVQARIAVDVARQVDGVRKVVKVFQSA